MVLPVCSAPRVLQPQGKGDEKPRSGKAAPKGGKPGGAGAPPAAAPEESFEEDLGPLEYEAELLPGHVIEVGLGKGAATFGG
jgi:hypothetical protein